MDPPGSLLYFPLLSCQKKHTLLGPWSSLLCIVLAAATNADLVFYCQTTCIHYNCWIAGINWIVVCGTYQHYHYNSILQIWDHIVYNNRILDHLIYIQCPMIHIYISFISVLIATSVAVAVGNIITIIHVCVLFFGFGIIVTIV